MLTLDPTNRSITGEAADFRNILKFASKYPTLDASGARYDTLWVDFEAEAVFATDGYVLIVVGPHTSRIDRFRATPIEKEVIAGLRETSTLRHSGNTWVVNDNTVVPITAPCCSPDVERLVPPRQVAHAEVFSLSANYLANISLLGKILGDSNLIVEMRLGPTARSPILVHAPGAKVVLMPCRV